MKTRDLTPPVAKTDPFVQVVHGNERTDAYFWLRVKGDDDVISYLEAENAYADSLTAHTQEQQEALYQEMKARIKETDVSAPIPSGGYHYYFRTLEGKQYRIYCRKARLGEESEDLMLDENLLAEGKDYFRLGAMAPSPDHKLLAHSTDFEGDEVYTLMVKDLETSKLLEDRIENTYYGVVWALDSKTLFYTTLDDAKRPYRVWRHELGTAPNKDEMIYEEKDETFRVWIMRSNSKRFLFVVIGSSTTSEVLYLDLATPAGQPKVIEPREHMVEYYPTHQGDRFLIRTNLEAKNFKVVEAPLESPSRANWKDVVPHRGAVKVEQIESFSSHFVVLERELGLNHFQIHDVSTHEAHRVGFPDPAFGADIGLNAEYDTNVVRLWFSSLVTPPTDYDYDMSSRKLTIVKQEEIHGFDPSDYATERLWAKAKDGVEIPISVAYKKPFEPDGRRPLFLYGYGSYGITIDPVFASTRLTYLDRGFVFAIAHVRGGGDLGEQWKEDGKLKKKINTFTDFISSAEHLISAGYSAPKQVVIGGGSAGGLLMGAVLNMRPDLFRAVIADVPFVDVINTMLDASIPLTAQEYEEWGDPNDKDYYDYMMQYSPYDNVGSYDYPDMLVTAGLNDPRVQYWEPAKWVAKLRTMKQGDNVLLLKTYMGAGHGGPSGRYDYLKELAYKAAFVFDRLGIGP